MGTSFGELVASRLVAFHPYLEDLMDSFVPSLSQSGFKATRI